MKIRSQAERSRALGELDRKPSSRTKFIHLEHPTGGSLCRRARGMPAFTTIVEDVTCPTCVARVAEFARRGAQ